MNKLMKTSDECYAKIMKEDPMAFMMLVTDGTNTKIGCRAEDVDTLITIFVTLIQHCSENLAEYTATELAEEIARFTNVLEKEGKLNGGKYVQ